MARSAHDPAILNGLPARVKNITKQLEISQRETFIGVLVSVGLNISESPDVISIMGCQPTMILQRTFTRKAKPFWAGNFQFVFIKMAM
tara:strand:- start:310 stop:573 length:264 start_codon:yes stop_codon:yes gene_type:complete